MFDQSSQYSQLNKLKQQHGGNMRRNFISILIMAIVITTISPLGAAEQPQTATSPVGDYTVGPGDVLNISVWNSESLTMAVTVIPDGKINFPFIGEIIAGGKTLAVLEKELKTKLHPFVPDPDLTVMMGQVNSILIYIIGNVNNPRHFVLNANVDVLQALAMAGGLNAFAKRNKIKIFRKTKGTTKIFPFEYDDVTEGDNLEQNIMLKRGDVVVVP
jgi:polysaccharide export outer membrane protein